MATQEELRLSLIACAVALGCSEAPPPSGPGSASEESPPTSGVGGSGAESPPIQLDDTPGNQPGGSVTPDTACATGMAVATRANAIVQLVVDTSDSMARAPGAGPAEQLPPPAESKWGITQNVLLRVLDELPPETRVGLSYFPGGPSEPNLPVCFRREVAVPIAPIAAVGSPQHEQLEGSLRTMQLDGYTPTHAALQFGAETLFGYPEPGARFILLITDGRPTLNMTCQRLDHDVVADSAPIIEEATKAAEGGIRTFVIGSPGSEDAVAALSRIATVGETARLGCSDSGPTYCHFDMTREPDFAAALELALREIVGELAACDFVIPPPPAGKALDPNKVSVVFSPEGAPEQPIPQAPLGDNCNEGWQFSADGSRVVLCSQTCNAFQASPNASVHVLFGCSAPPPR